MKLVQFGLLVALNVFFFQSCSVYILQLLELFSKKKNFFLLKRYLETILDLLKKLLEPFRTIRTIKKNMGKTRLVNTQNLNRFIGKKLIFDIDQMN